MDIWVTVFLASIGAALTLGLVAFGLQSRREGERRATRVALGVAAAGAVLRGVVVILPPPVQRVLAVLLAVSLLLGGILLALPVGRVTRCNEAPQRRVDEQDIMFARARLKPGSAEYAAYYALHPENRAIDDRICALPGLLASTAQ